MGKLVKQESRSEQRALGMGPRLGTPVSKYSSLIRHFLTWASLYIQMGWRQRYKEACRLAREEPRLVPRYTRTLQSKGPSAFLQ